MNIERVVYSPVITEKANHLRESNGQFVFRVSSDANKVMIKDALEKLFDVKVKHVATLKVREKPKRNRKMRAVYKRGWKKAIVTLQHDSKKFDFYEGV